MAVEFEYPAWQRSRRSSPGAGKPRTTPSVCLAVAKGGSLFFDTKKGKVREALRNPIEVLNSLISKASNEGYHYERLYRNLYNAEFFLTAYQNIYAKPGNMTAGTDGKTIDGMGMERIDRLIASLKDHSYQPNPARRKYIEKKNSTACRAGSASTSSLKKRPLGIPSIEDKLVQEVVRMILESIYEPTFSNYSHGFRPKRSCHTALLQLQKNFTGTTWFIEGDIKGFFDNIDHTTLVNILRRRIKDEYFIALIWKFLKAGYLEDWVYHPTYTGTPQGSLISPVLSNIYLNEFDKYMAKYIGSFKLGKKRKPIEGYYDIEWKLRQQRYEVCAPERWETMTDSQKQEALKKIRELKAAKLGMKFSDPLDGGFRRLFYVRYADDWVCGVIGAKADAERVKADIKQYLSEQLKLELSEEKTLITNARDAARFLGYDVFVSDSEHFRKDKNGHTRRAQRGKVKLYVPRDKWQNKLIEYGALQIKYHNGKEIFNPTHRSYLISNDDLEILNKYNAEIRGMYNYYRIADNVSVLGHFNYVMKFSMFKTFGGKYKLHISQVRKKYGYQKFGVKYPSKDGEKTMYFYDGGFKKQRMGIETADVDIIPQLYQTGNRNGLITRLKARQCEWCCAENVKLEIHHVRKLRDLQGKKRWEKLMIARKRKTMALCVSCHDSLHAGKLD